MPKISELPYTSSPTTDDSLPIVDSGVTRKTTLNDLPISAATQNAINSLTKAQVGLGNVDNTSDASKPISTAQAAGLVAKTSATGAGLLPAGTTAQRDAATSAGMTRFNTTLKQFEGHDGAAWWALGGSIAVFRAANATTQSVSSNVLTKVLCDSEQEDVGGFFDPATGRYTPLIAGYYLFWGGISSGGTGLNNAQAILYKNGAVATFLGANGNGGWVGGSSGPIYMNGTTDYVELWGKVSGTSTTFLGTGDTFLRGVLFARA